MYEEALARKTGSRRSGRRRRDARRDRRADLIRAGIPLLSRPGRPPRVEDITSAADTGKGTFYLYFPSWGAYLSAVRDHLLLDYQREMQSRVKSIESGNYWLHFESEIRHFIQWMKSYGSLHRSVFHGAEVDTTVPPDLSAQRAIVGMLEIGKRFGHVSEAVESAICARLVLSALHGAVGTLEVAPEADVVGETVRFLRSAVAADPTRRSP